MAETTMLYSLAQEGHFGIYDAADCIWLGTDEGPITYERADVAHAALTILSIRLGYNPKSLAVKVYDGTGNRIRDTLDAKMTGLEAIRIAEGDSLRPRRKRRAPSTGGTP